jgi:hypothetical protein
MHASDLSSAFSQPKYRPLICRLCNKQGRGSRAVNTSYQLEILHIAAIWLWGLLMWRQAGGGVACLALFEGDPPKRQNCDVHKPGVVLQRRQKAAFQSHETAANGSLVPMSTCSQAKYEKLWRRSSLVDMWLLSKSGLWDRSVWPRCV